MVVFYGEEVLKGLFKGIFGLGLWFRLGLDIYWFRLGSCVFICASGKENPRYCQTSCRKCMNKRTQIKLNTVLEPFRVNSKVWSLSKANTLVFLSYCICNYM